jgi:CTD small phosphatase-like protein 2
LLELSKYYELVIFTAALQDYADFILDIIDNNKVITHRLYRQHTTIQNGQSVKVPNIKTQDLSRLGRDLAKMLIIDNLPENFSC